MSIALASASSAAAQQRIDSVPNPPVVRTASGLSYQILVRGSGEKAGKGHSVQIHEIVTLSNGALVFNSRTGKNPITFLIGGNQAIAGMDEGVTGMQVGEIRRLVIPPSLSLRSGYPPNTPKDSTLYSDVELVSIKRP